MNLEEKKYPIERYDLSKDKSLKAWNAADEYLLQTFHDIENKPKHLGIYNDRFGFLACHLNAFNPSIILTTKSQEKAIDANLKENQLVSVIYTDPLGSLDNKLDIVLVKIPKSLDLFQLFLEHITQNSTQEVTVICSFMTRHFSPKLLQIAEAYFEEVTQGRALKKARVVVLNKKKKTIPKDLITTLEYNNQQYKQYPGVFSSNHIDYATQFFLDNIEIKESDQCILDLASGNGVIANEIFKQQPNAEYHLIDDAFLAVASAKLNLQGDNIHHHFNNELSIFEDEQFDLIVSNPPFHIEYEINVQIPLELFRTSYRCLKTGGTLQVVANKHLNYKVHLEPIFSSVEVVAEDKKFIVYKCVK